MDNRIVDQRFPLTPFPDELGMELVTPKNGIYKDGHERPDTVLARKEYTAKLNQFKDREVCFTGEQLQTLVLLQIQHCQR